MLNEREQQLSEVLLSMAETLDIPPSKYKQATERYKAVGLWLEDGQYDGCTGKPAVGPQGSFRLGTVVRPLRNGKEADYDIDLVCELSQARAATTPANVKTSVGDRLKENPDYNRMLDKEGRRCWTLQYAEQDVIVFHMVVLPSVPDPDLGRETTTVHEVPWQYARHVIAITEKHKHAGTYSWRKGGSNPTGYAEWFDSANQPLFDKVAGRQKQLLVERHGSIYCSVEEVPNALVRTPLQRAIQLLKRHRDMRFLGHRWEADKPISMIITTLAARTYENEGDVYTALMGIVHRLERFAILLRPGAVLGEDIQDRLIEKREDRWYIPNPVNPGENFADRWNEPDSHKADAFFRWVGWVKNDIQAAVDASDMEEAKLILTPSFGKRVSEAAIPAHNASAVSRSAYPRLVVLNPTKPWSPDACR